MNPAQAPTPSAPLHPARRSRRRARLLWGASALVLIVVALAAVLGFWARTRLLASLPVLDGEVPLPGLSAPVVVTRDARGVPTVRGRARDDVARALGFLHAQDRFFQMDLSRRRAAGELAELVGSRALEADLEMRLHRFRAQAREAWGRMTAADRATLEAYAEGANAGLAALGAAPFEYYVLRQTPAQWQPEDPLLVILSMFVLLQEPFGGYEATLATMQDVLPPEMVAFLAPDGTEWDAPIDGSELATPPIPGPAVYNLRERRRNEPPVELPDRGREQARWPAVDTSGTPDAALGSNSWVVSGAHTADGRPLLANDMHLPIRVPNTWYRAVLEWPDASEPSGWRSIAGITLPGIPAVVAGTNTHVAWGFTNTYADWGDLVLIELHPDDANRYRTPDGWRPFERHRETIRVAGGADRELVVSWTIWGPVIGPDYKGRVRAYRWAAHAPDRLAAALRPIENARTVADVFDAANGLGAPGQNIVAVDRAGTIGWSIFGAIPRRVGLDGRLPTSWSDGTRGWHGWLDPSEYPRIINPPSGRIWTANARVVGGRMLATLGDGSYEVGSRATIIRNRLAALEDATARDLLAIQLDTSADFLSRWRDLLLATLTPDATAGNDRRALFHEIVTEEWTGRADADSSAYRLVRTFRDAVSRRVIRFVLAECYEADPDFDYMRVRRREGPIWKLVSERPMHLLDPRYASWDDLLLSAVDEVIAGDGVSRGGDLRARVWSDFNVTGYRHPLSSAIPFGSRLLDMPAKPLPGDLFTPRLHWGAAAASQRMVVSPGREAEGILQTPAGQSGHPLSPFYSSFHEEWLNGDPTPLLPGPARHTLTLVPAAGS